jgi:hypothetical protein
MDFSMNTLMLAIKAVQRDIARHEALLEDDSLSDADCDEYGELVLDLTKALGELGETYEAERGKHEGLPTFDELIAAG